MVDAGDSCGFCRASRVWSCSSESRRPPTRSSNTRRHWGGRSRSPRRSLSADALAWIARMSSSEGASLGTNAVAPAASAASRTAGSALRNRSALSGSSAVTIRASSIPESPGRAWSRTMSSGRRLRASASAPGPSAASPAALKPACSASSARTAARTSSFASAMRTRITERPSSSTSSIESRRTVRSRAHASAPLMGEG